MLSTLNALAGEPTGEDVAQAVESIASNSTLDVAAIVARFNALDEQINKINTTLNELMAAQISPEPEPEPEPDPEPDPNQVKSDGETEPIES